MSAAGGLWNAGVNGKILECEVIQFFSRSPQGGQPKPIDKETIEKFKTSLSENDIKDSYIHAPYFVNLASAQTRISHGSVNILRGELERGSLLGVRAMMFHPGSARDVGKDKGTKMVIDGLNRILDGYTGSCKLLIEISAGAGEVMGDEFEELALFLEKAERGKEIGICFDTQHAFASGYDLRKKEDVEATFKKFDDIIGLNNLVASHCNDSLVELGAKKDRHEHLGDGYIGKNAFKFIVQHPKLQHIDLILETPFKKDEKSDPRVIDMKLLQKFRKSL